MAPAPLIALRGDARRNFWLCVSNGALASMGSAFFAYETIMAGFAYQLTGSTALVGALTTVAAIGWQWPQLLVGSRIEHRPRKMPTYNLSVAIRLLSLAGLVASALTIQHAPLLLFAAIFFFSATFSTGGGICVVPFMDIVAKSIPYTHRPTVFAYRQFLGGMLGAVSGLAAAWLLARPGAATPRTYALLFTLAFGINSLAYLSFMLTRETVEAVAPNRIAFREYLRRGPAIFRNDADYRRFYLFRVCIAFVTMSQAIFVPFAVSAFGAPPEKTGWFAAAVTLASGLSSLFWGRISRRFGEVVLLRLGAAGLLIAPATALLLTLLPQMPLLQQWMSAHYVWAFLFLFAAHTASFNATVIGSTVYLLSLAPQDRRPTYISFMNTLSAPLTATPILAGLIAQYLGFGAAFALSSCAAAAALLTARRLRLRPQDA
ncbi:MAG: MFS transporter [Candidatus Hydrogenedentes bacterium]|nr:MFS transporter [Candidatus Hydrogenedentota bacterium]